MQNRVNNALASAAGSRCRRKASSIRAKSTSILQFVTLISPDGRYDALYMWNYATINLVNELARLPGVGNVTVMGAGEYSMRIWMDPQKLHSFDLVPQDVIKAVKQQSQAGGGGAGRDAARAEGPGIPIHHRYRVAAERSQLSSAISSSRTRPPRAAGSSG